MTKIIELIYTEGAAGRGEEGSPVRRIIELYTKTGELVAKYDVYTHEAVFNAEPFDRSLV